MVLPLHPANLRFGFKMDSRQIWCSDLPPHLAWT